MTTLTAHLAFDSRDIAAFSASAESITISRDSQIVLASAEDETVEAVFNGSFGMPATGSDYGKVGSVSFYSSDVLQYTLTATFSLSADGDGMISFPAPDTWSASKLFQGNDKYIGSTDNDYISVYDNRGKDVYYGLDGNDYLELSTQGRSIAGGGAGDDLLYSLGNKDRLTGGDGNDFFWLEAAGATITDFSAADDKILLPKGYYEERMMDDWLNGNASDFPVEFGTDANDDFTIAADYIVVVEGMKTKRTVRDAGDDYFIYDQGAGKFYFDQDGLGGKKAVLLVTLSDKPQLSADDWAGCLVFDEHADDFRTYWIDNFFS